MNNHHVGSSAARVTHTGVSFALRRSLLLLVAMAGVLFVDVRPALAAQAQRAYDFTNAVGIRIDLDHVNYQNNYNLVKSSLGDLKIKNVRTDGTNLGTNPTKLSRVVDLHTTHGILFDFVFGNALQPLPTMQASVDAAIGTGAVLAFEGANEWSKHYYQDHNDNWAQEVKDFQVALKTYVRNNGWPTGPLLCPTAWRRDRWAYEQLDAIGVDNYCSVGNLHYYHNNTLKPTSTRAADRTAPYTYALFDATMDEAIADQQALKPGTWVTETGESVTAGGDDGGSGQTPIVAAKYLSRLITEFFRRDVAKIFIFELMDSGAGAQYGLLDATGTARPAFDSLKNLMTILNNPAATSFTPGSLNFSLNGATGITSLLLQKGNGTFYLLLWKDVLSTDTDQTQLVTLSWGFSSPSVKTYLPLNSTTPVNTWTNRTQIQANVRDHILIVEIAP